MGHKGATQPQAALPVVVVVVVVVGGGGGGDGGGGGGNGLLTSGPMQPVTSTTRQRSMARPRPTDRLGATAGGRRTGTGRGRT